MSYKGSIKLDRKLEKELSRALKDCIYSHGPIDKKWVGSAIKRMAPVIANELTKQKKEIAKELSKYRCGKHKKLFKLLK